MGFPQKDARGQRPSAEDDESQTRSLETRARFMEENTPHETKVGGLPESTRIPLPVDALFF